MISWLLQRTSNGSTYLQVLILLIVLAAVVFMFIDTIKEIRKYK